MFVFPDESFLFCCYFFQQVLVKPGDKVSKGDVLIAVEGMKMEVRWV